MRSFRGFRRWLIDYYNRSVESTAMRVAFAMDPKAQGNWLMGMLLYLLLSAGFFILMMRFCCGVHVMGHGQHGGHDAEGRWKEDGSNRSTGATNDVAPKPAEHTHG